MPPRRQPATDTLLFIPEAITEAYQEDAAQQVREAWANRPAPVQIPVRTALLASEALAGAPAPTGSWWSSPKWAGYERTFLTLAVVMALAGWAVCTGWWAWLAYDTGSPTWITIAVAGAVALMLGVVASTHLWLRRHQAAVALKR